MFAPVHAATACFSSDGLRFLSRELWRQGLNVSCKAARRLADVAAASGDKKGSNKDQAASRHGSRILPSVFAKSLATFVCCENDMRAIATALLLTSLFAFTACSTNNDNAHTTATTIVPPPPKQQLQIATRPATKTAPTRDHE